MAKLLFWISAGFAVYVYVGYPILLWGLQAVFRSSPGQQSVEPSVSLLVAAYNEAAVIADKIRNSLALDYPADKLEVVIASDGSKDATAEIVRSFARPAKPADEFGFSTSRRIAARWRFSMTPYRNCAERSWPFPTPPACWLPTPSAPLFRASADPRVGAASGVYRLLKKDQAQLGSQEDLYWKYETFLKVQEAKLGAFTGAHGSLYAIRRALYPFPSADTINDDFTIPMRILRARLPCGIRTRCRGL